MKTLYIIIAFCAGLFLGHLFMPTEKEINAPVTTELNQSKQELHSIDSNYTVKQSAYEKQNDSLIKELKGYKFLLATARKELNSKREKTFALVNEVQHDTVFHCNSVLVDSLYDQIAITNQYTDSIITQYQQRDTLLECMVAIRDTQLVMCNKSYQESMNLAHEQMLREQKLTDDLNTVLKQQKRKRIQNRLLAAGMLFVSGIATTLYIKTKQ